jgi:hypothetical protein
MRRIAVGALLAAAVSVAGGATSALPAAAGDGPPGDPEVVATGLNNPRQLSMLGNGDALLIAEAGRGGSLCGAEGPEGPMCLGATGSIALVRHAWAAHDVRPRRIVTGLLSAAGPDGGFAVGSDGVSARSLDKIYIQMTYAPPDVLPAPLPTEQAGKLLLARHGAVSTVADVSAVELAADPDGQGTDSDPYAVLSLPGDRQLVADAAGNDILEVHGGHVRVWAVLANHDGNQAVPTSLAVDAHGTIYVGELNGENPGTARVYRFTQSGRLLGWTGGFTTVTGVAVGQDGSLYVSELFAGGDNGPPGQVTEVLRGGARVHYPVPFPAGLAVDRQYHVYVSAWSIADADGTDLGGGAVSPPGQVWRLTT